MKNKIINRIKNILPDSSITVSTQDDLHFLIEVADASFKDIPKLSQHRLVLKSLQDLIASNEIHAIELKTKIN